MISDRQEALLMALINEYIQTAEPVSSKILEKSGFFGLSSATIRAEMNELESLGYLAHIFTSSGRVPTERAYRRYVDNVEEVELKTKEKIQIRSALASAGDEPRDINRAIAQTLSDLSANLVITGIVEEDDFFKIGLSNLFELPEFHEFERVFRLTSFFDEFEAVFNGIAKEFLSQDDVRVFIGRENPIKNVQDETVMFAKYDLPQNYTGSLTLVGPMRMDYKKNINLVRYATNEANKLFAR